MLKRIAVCLAVLLACCAAPPPKTGEAWNCSTQQFRFHANGREFVEDKKLPRPTPGNGEFVLQVKPPVIDLLHRGRWMVGYDIVKQTSAELVGQRHYDEAGEITDARIRLDKRTGNVRQWGSSHRRDSNRDQGGQDITSLCVAAAR